MSSLMINLRHSTFLHSCQGNFKRWRCPWVLVLVLVTRFVWISVDLKRNWMSDQCNNSVGKLWFMEFSQERVQKTQNIVDIQCNARWYEGLETWKSDTLPTSSAAVLRHLVTALRLISYWKHCWSLSEQLHAVISSFACSSYINMRLFLLKFLTLLTRLCLSQLSMAMVKLNPEFVYTIWLYDWSDFHKKKYIWIDEILHTLMTH